MNSNRSKERREKSPGSSTEPRDLLRDLENCLPGAVRSRISDRLAFSHDASHFLFTPQVVVVPNDVDQISALFKVSKDHNVPVTFRSGGTSLSGQAGAEGMLIDTRQNFRGITVLSDGERVRVQPGATIRAVNNRLSPYQSKLGPDPASEVACTVGGVVANNSSGMACGIEFNSYQTLESLILVLPSGTILNTAAADADEKLRLLEPDLYVGLLELRDRVRNNSESVATINRLFAVKNTMGYGLNSLIDYSRAIDILAHLVIGSEGTLAFVAEATFRTIPVKKHLATGLLLFEDLRAATASLEELVSLGFATIELLDSTSLRVAQSQSKAEEALTSIVVKKHAAFLVEFQEGSKSELEERVEEAKRSFGNLPLTKAAALKEDPKTRAGLWHIRKGLYASVAGSRPSGTTALLEDIAVPVESLFNTCESLVDLFEKHDYEKSVIFGHAKDGNIHFLINEEFNRDEKINRYISFTEDMVDLVLSQGGTLKAEHGTGRIMAPYVRRQYGDELYEVMQEIKKLCDPRGILNPGVILNEDPRAFVTNLKVTPSVESEVDRCVECGYCEPVCPSKDLTFTPRQRIVVRREIAGAKLAGKHVLLKELESDFRYKGLDTCAVDGMCQTACPVDIDTGELVRRLRAENLNSVSQFAWRQLAKRWGLMTKVSGFALSAAQKLPASLITSISVGTRKILGADSFPLWGRDLPSGGSPRYGQRVEGAQVLYFPSCMGALFGNSTGADGVSSAFLALCERAGIKVVIPEGIEAMCCGTPWKSKGFGDGYQMMQNRVLPKLLEASRGGQIPILTDGSSCTEGLEHLIKQADARYSGLRLIDALTFVDEHILPRLKITRRIDSLALHPTCSSTRLDVNAAMKRIGEAIAIELFISDEWGCCGFAGDRGLLHPELTASATAREVATMSGREFTAYASVNRTCEIGMSRAMGRPYQHLLEILEGVSR